MPNQNEQWEAYKEAVLEKMDLTDLFGGLVQQQSTSDGWVTALCPFHDDHSPSFAYNQHTGKWCCFHVE